MVKRGNFDSGLTSGGRWPLLERPRGLCPREPSHFPAGGLQKRAAKVRPGSARFHLARGGPGAPYTNGAAIPYPCRLLLVMRHSGDLGSAENGAGWDCPAGCTRYGWLEGPRRPCGGKQRPAGLLGPPNGDGRREGGPAADPPHLGACRDEAG